MFYLLYEPVCIYIICSYWYTGRSYYSNCMYYRSFSHAYTYIYILRCSTHPFVQRESILAWFFSTLQIYDMIYVYIICVYCIYIYISTWFAFCNRYGIHNKWAIGHCLKTMNFFPRRIWLALEWPRWLWTWGWVPLHLGRFWWKRWMLDVEIEDNLGIFLSTPIFFFGGFAILY